MKKLVVIPSDSLKALIHAGWSFEQLSEYYNPQDFFDEVYCLFPYEETKIVGKINYIKAEPEQFKKIIKQIKPDVIRGYGGGWASIYANANRVKNIPIIISVHDVNPLLIDSSLRWADRVVCMSKAVKEAVMKITHIDENKISILPNRIDVQKFSKKEDEGFKKYLIKRYGEGKFILHVGRKAEQKNLDTVIKSMKYLPKEYKAVFLGAGDSEPYRILAKKLNVENRCFFEDSISSDKLPYYYSWCDCMCTPSRWEGFGFVFIEAAACECAIVTSDIAPMNEYLKDKENAILVKDYNDAKKISNEILEATQVNENTENMRKMARKMAIQFMKEKVDEMEVEIYKDIVNCGANNEIIKQINGLKKKKVILFGAGTNGRKILNCLEEDKIAYFVDNDEKKTGKNIDGIKVISYEMLLKKHKDYMVVITPDDRKEIEDLLLKDEIPYISSDLFLAINQLNLEDYHKMSPEYLKSIKLINESFNIVDLGCGTNPLPQAKVAVDKYIEPIHRIYGQGKSIDITRIEQTGRKFICADFENLPFESKEFDLAYSRHVVEHLEHPEKALKEMQRIAKKGIIMCPSIFAENIYGRTYHKWEITWRDNLIVFIEKRSKELWFGEGPKVIDGKTEIPLDCNPFDIILNDGDWYNGNCYDKRLRKLLRKYWYGHFSIMENIFIWENNFDFLIVYNDGTITNYNN